MDTPNSQSIKDGYFEKRWQLASVKNNDELAGIPSQDRDLVLHTALELMPVLEAWLKDYPAFEGVLARRIAATTLVGVAISPHAPRDVMINTTIISLILFALDDITDSVIGDTTPEQIVALNRILEGIAAAGGEASEADFPALATAFPSSDFGQPWVQGVRAFADFCRRLKTYSQAELYYPFFAKQVAIVQQSGIDELEWWEKYLTNNRTVLPVTYEEYLTNRCISIAAPIVMGALLIMLGRPVSFTADLEKLVQDFSLDGGGFLGLANDIRSFERERDMDAKFNALLILLLTGNAREVKDAEVTVLKDAGAYLEKFEQTLPLLPEELAEWVDSLKRMVYFNKHWYMSHEFHHLTREALADYLPAQ